MKINIDNFDTSKFELFDLIMTQKEVGGGVTSKEEIDTIRKYPEAKSLIISGLKQDTFEYLIENYGHQFDAISFWKNKLVNDLSCLSKLNNIKYIHYFFNQKVEGLWDMTNNICLKGLALYDFSRLHTFDKIEFAPDLEYFAAGNRVWSKMEIASLKPLINSTVTHFGWSGYKVRDNDYMCLSRSNIVEIDMSIRRFTMEELARIITSIPNLRGTITRPYTEGSIIKEHVKTTYYFLCKGKRTLIKGKDDDKLKKYLEDFERLLEIHK